MHPPNSADMADVLIRDARVGDGEGLATCWLDLGRYVAALSPEHFYSLP